MEKCLVALLLFAGLILASCGSSDSSPEKVPVPPASMFMERSYHFCSEQEKDQFLLGYYGSNLPDTLIYFFIISHHGDTIYRDDWPSRNMVAEGAEANESNIMAAMETMMDTSPQNNETCSEGGRTYAYLQELIGFCKGDETVVKL